MNQDQVPEYSQLQEFQNTIRKAKTQYLLRLISLGYVFEQQGMYELTAYWAIHKDYYKIPDERWLDDFDGTTTPDYFPKGAFIRIDSMSESETEDPWETSYFLWENGCSIEYLK